MDVMEVIRKRESVRDYLDKPVAKDKLLQIFEAARLAPSANNKQEWRFVAVTDPQKRQELQKAAGGQKFVSQAPVVIAACAETDGRRMTCGQLAYPIDVAIAIDHLTLKAAEEGLGTCWIGKFYEDQVKRILNIPEQIRVVQLVTLGYPKYLRGEKHRKNLDEIVKFERWE